MLDKQQIQEGISPKWMPKFDEIMDQDTNPFPIWTIYNKYSLN